MEFICSTVLAATIYSLLGIMIFGLGFFLINGIAPFSLRKEIEEGQNTATATTRVFVGGGGDGLAVREILIWRAGQSATLLDIDPMMTQLARTNSRLTRLNERSLIDPRVQVINDDAI